jgi:two-component system chemotaxis response regulator CheB
VDKASVACAAIRAHTVHTTRDVIVIGAAEGSLSGLRRLLSAPPASLPAAVLVVLHAPLQALQLDLMLDKTGFLPTVYAEEDQAGRRQLS